MKSLDGERARPSSARGACMAVKAGVAVLVLTWPLAASASGPDAWGADGRHPPASRPIGHPAVPAARGVPAPPRGGYDRPYRPHYGRWSPGQVLPPDAPAVVITDYERFHLRRPPQGYAWVSCDGDFILTASATGQIFEVIPGAAQ